MNKIREWVRAVRTFMEEVRTELKKCAWPDRSELYESTAVVIISVVILSAFVAVSDSLFMWLMGLVIR